MEQGHNTKHLEDRGLNVEVAAQMGCMFKDGNYQFEYRDMDEVVAVKFRSLEKSFWFKPSMPHLMWNFDSIRELKSKTNLPLVCTEGEFDAISVSQSFNCYAVSVPNGANGKRSEGVIHPEDDQGFKYLWDSNGRLKSEFDNFSKIILATDADEKGFILRDELAVRLGASRCWFVEYPEECKDANDVLSKYGEDTLKKVLSNAKPIRPGYLIKPGDIPPRGVTLTYESGWPELNKHLKLVRPELFVVTGQPGHGKTQWMRSLTFHLAELHGWRIAYLTPEDPSNRLKRDMIRFSNRPSARINGYDSSSDWINDMFRISNPPEDDPITMQFVMEEIDSSVLHHDCKVFVIDPWNEISHDRGGSTETEYIEKVLVELKRKARKYNIIIIIVAHPRKIEEGKKVNLYDISGSANWRNKSDHGVIVHRSSPENMNIQIIIERCKDHETMGVPGNLWMNYNRNESDFECGTKCLDNPCPSSSYFEYEQMQQD